MKYSRNPKLLANARNLRKSMTRQERHLWYDALRYCKPRFRRQEIIGDYIADFFCHEASLVIELDGSQHYQPENTERDTQRTEYFHSLGIRILRFSNADVDNRFDSVCAAILLALKQCGVSAAIVFDEGEDNPSVTAAP